MSKKSQNNTSKETTFEWLVEGQVVLITAYNWDLETFTDDILTVKTMIDESSQPLVHTLWDFRELKRYPSKLPEINKGVKPLFTHERFGWVITVMDNQLIAFLSQMATSLYRVRYRTFKDMDEAKAFLVSADPTLERIP